jgi:glucose/arabinose dehydrogenase
MALSMNGAAVLVSAVVLGLAGWVIRRPIEDALQGGAGSVSSALSPSPANPALTVSARVRFEPVAAGFAGPVGLEFIPGRPPHEAIVLEKGGRARLVSLPTLPTDVGTGGGTASLGAPSEPGPDAFTVEVESESELGLLGLAFHPRYTENGLFYLNTNPKDDGPLRTRISEWQWRAETAGKELAMQKRVLLEIDQPFKNHDGGQVAFGPDGYLYIGMGDGGSREDPQGHGQNLGSLLGKMLRIDVNSAPGYKVPADNPFLGTPGARPEIWAYGLRNPWRFSFDPKGRLIAADVGQDSYEEVDIVTAGANLGWNVREGNHCFKPRQGCRTEGLVDPIFEYGRDAGQSITGGYVYLGERMPWLAGKYVVGDFVTGRVWALTLSDDPKQAAQAEVLGVFPHAFSAFARSPNGELYALDFARGLVLQLLPV